MYRDRESSRRPPTGPESLPSYLSFEEYIAELTKVITAIDKEKTEQATNMLFEACNAGNQIFVFGNGGSVSTADHMVLHLTESIGGYNESIKFSGAAVSSLRLNVASSQYFKALDRAEPVSWAQSFVMELKGRIKPGDVLIAISGSGQSPNILRALEYGKAHGAKTIGFLGFKTGGRAATLVDCPIIIDSNNYGPIEDAHIALAHIIAGGLERKIKEQSMSKGKR